VKTYTAQMNNALTYNYDTMSNVTSVIDTRGKSHSFLYNNLYELVTATDPLNAASSFIPNYSCVKE
jgi:YD repeat-containing protein